MTELVAATFNPANRLSYFTDVDRHFEVFLSYFVEVCSESTFDARDTNECFPKLCSKHSFSHMAECFTTQHMEIFSIILV